MKTQEESLKSMRESKDNAVKRCMQHSNPILALELFVAGMDYAIRDAKQMIAMIEYLDNMAGRSDEEMVKEMIKKGQPIIKLSDAKERLELATNMRDEVMSEIYQLRLSKN